MALHDFTPIVSLTSYPNIPTIVLLLQTQWLVNKYFKQIKPSLQGAHSLLDQTGVDGGN